VRDAIKQKDVKTTKSGGTLEGPAVSFGYEKTSSAAATAGTDTAYHASSPEIVLPGLTMLQSPIISRRGRLEKTGHRISGACTFYAPSLNYIRALDNFKNTIAFAELESYDKLYDIERVILNPTTVSSGGGTSTRSIYTFTNPTAGYEIDRIQFQIKTAGTLDYVEIIAVEGGGAKELRWDGGLNENANLTLSSSAWITIDLPIRDIAVGDTTSVYKDGTPYILTAANPSTAIMDIDKLTGADSNNRIDSIDIRFTGSVAHEIRNIYLYKEAEWRVESIKDYRDEYMQIAAVRVRGERASRRRAYG
jgi:hypothetical protein